MCFGGDSGAAQQGTSSYPSGYSATPIAPPAQKDPAQDLLDREAIRQSNVLLGKANIDRNFKQFDDPYYQSYQDAYKGNYIPQLDDQYKSAVAKMLVSMAGRGMDMSSVGAAKQGGLAKDYTTAKSTIASDASDAANTLRSNVEQSKANLYALNSASADPAAADAQALGQSKTLVAPPTYSPLGDVFASALQPVTSFQSARNNTPIGPAYTSPFTTRPRKTGSATVVK